MECVESYLQKMFSLEHGAQKTMKNIIKKLYMCSKFYIVKPHYKVISEYDSKVGVNYMLIINNCSWICSLNEMKHTLKRKVK